MIESNAGVFDLQAQARPSTVLARWAAQDPGRAGRVAAASMFPQAQQVVQDRPNGSLTAEQLLSLLGGNTSASGVHVTPDVAMRVSAVYACVSLIAGAIATLPLAIYERDGDARRKAQHDYWWMLNEQACEEFTAAAAFEYLICAKLFHGDGIAELLHPSPSSSRVIGWRPHHPDCVRAYRDGSSIRYAVRDAVTGQTRGLEAADVIHLPSLGFDGLCSPSPITHAAREAIGTAVAAQGYAGKFFNGGATFDYALKTDRGMEKPQVEALLISLRARESNPRAPLILTNGMQPAQLSVNSRDAEILATRLFSVEEICSILGVPPHMVGHTDKTTSWGSGIEQQGMGFVRYTLTRHLTPLAQELNRKLWPTRARYFVEHVTAALERGDVKARYDAYRVALGRAGERPFMTVDEVRRIENMPPDAALNHINTGAPDAQQAAATAG